MARMRERIFAGFGAVLFLGSACVVTVYAMMQGSKDNATPAAQTQQTCAEQAVSGGEKMAAPDAYKPDGAVSSLQTTDLTQGSGAAAKSGDCLQMQYYGTLASDGTMFDQDFTTGEALQFQLGKGQVITGWDQGIPGMKVGGVRRLVIPAALGYGDQANGKIPANSDLIFTVKLVKIVKS
jgi:peptidylprolyl isomerase